MTFLHYDVLTTNMTKISEHLTCNYVNEKYKFLLGDKNATNWSEADCANVANFTYKFAMHVTLNLLILLAYPCEFKMCFSANH